ncbi:hypothetical protein NDU88_002333 [Pleurodeles waltl]|uniref:Uncharacterized protein n=1 Tax=Pleurodeles waltl TaxID=8319 RepID=A0AAV7M1V9_PLEWA|nr:hypothetical protein NDU88_002333 [Pleurodeles waltl]
MNNAPPARCNAKMASMDDVLQALVVVQQELANSRVEAAALKEKVERLTRNPFDASASTPQTGTTINSAFQAYNISLERWPWLITSPAAVMLPETLSLLKDPPDRVVIGKSDGQGAAVQPSM